ncbi:hypothetical protein [Alteriqipengyuania lutimaris]|uniref:Uncharacterized protein n=1 Tax=Alteriqipengyuania lutimaris TaxID=1538146 RepID=A0A395LGQ3_9SPHN|nr:hypothetical protein [Alteriqipengyuania lutimaris]MBB3035380.1 hypothetical protein [Alteriqipengyuania lutimaris]RDS75963.1 hypothetical protein DL238_14930 [Alteriqipengyuania lutimaris]
MADVKKTDDRDPRNVMVKALRAHSNDHGEKFKKAKGAIYLHPRPAGDIAAGIVEIADEEASEQKATAKKAHSAPKRPRATAAAKTEAAKQ